MKSKKNREGKVTLDLPEELEEGAVVSEKVLAKILLNARLGVKSKK